MRKFFLFFALISFTIYGANAQQLLPVNNLTGVASDYDVTLSWEKPYQLEGEATIILETHNIWGDGTGYQLLLDADANEYGSTIPAAAGFIFADCYVPETLYDGFEYKIPENADPTCNSQNIVVDGEVSITVPAGIYDYCIVNPVPDDKLYIATGLNGRKDDFAIEGGKTYRFLIELVGYNDNTTIIVTDNATGKVVDVVRYENQNPAKDSRRGLNYVNSALNNDNYPETRALKGYKIYRDGNLISEIADANTLTYVDEGLEVAKYNYCVVAVYDEGESVETCTEVNVTGPFCPPASGVKATTNGGLPTTITWNPPQFSVNEEITYGFEGDVIADGWEIIKTNPNESWVKVGAMAYTTGDVYPHEGSFQMKCHWDWTTQDEWLITPEFTLPEGGKLRFWMYGQYGSQNNDHYFVKVSNDGGENWAKLWDASTILFGPNHYDEAIEIDLSEFAGQNIKVAWNAQGEEGLWYSWFIDAVTIESGDGEVLSFDGQKIISLPATNKISDYSTSNASVARDTKGFISNASAPANKAAGNILFTDDFESGNLNNWTLFDYDGDGYNWQIHNGEPHSGEFVASSWSWDNYVPLNPDNWMIAPMVEGATFIQYYVASNNDYPDFYAVMASSNGIDASDFTTVFEEFVPTVPTGKEGNEAVKSTSSTNGDRLTTPWVERNIQLPEGTKFVAFRHFNSEDNNYLLVDDVAIYIGSPLGDFTYTLRKDGVEIATGLTSTSYVDVNTAEGTYEYCVEVVYETCTSVPACAAPIVVGIENEVAMNSVNVYPNPASDVIYVKGDVTNVVMYNSLGQVVRTGVNKGQIDVTSLQNGIYYITLIGSDKSRKVEKVIIAK